MNDNYLAGLGLDKVKKMGLKTLSLANKSLSGMLGNNYHEAEEVVDHPKRKSYNVSGQSNENVPPQDSVQLDNVHGILPEEIERVRKNNSHKSMALSAKFATKTSREELRLPHESIEPPFIDDSRKLSVILSKFYEDQTFRTETGSLSLNYVLNQKGATKKIIKYIKR